MLQDVAASPQRTATEGEVCSGDRSDESAQVNLIRGFNRFYSTVLAGLNEHLANTEFSLTEVRVLFALYTGQSANPSDLRNALRLDAGYLSRILRRFEHEGLIERSRSDVDGRRHELSLTDHGNARAHQLYVRADNVQVELLSHLEPSERGELTAAMTAIKAILERHMDVWQ